ncbi:DnrO protein [Luteimonas sp. MJ250]|uniref:DnrO protein n=1 Tax=Luteimonas sp. MJ250 TaxID=3129236 RepID=UPI0031BB324A
MNLKQIPLALALTLAIAAMAGCAQDSTPAASAADAGAIEQVAHAEDDAHDAAHDADHAHAAAAALGVDFPVPDNHEPWAPDAPLIEGMSRVRTAVAGLEARPDEATVIARAADVDDAVEYMFANCSLPTEPDIALHAILARLMAGTQALQENPADAAPVADMHAALENYRTLFDDPNS